MPSGPVVLEDLKAVDVQHPDHRVLAVHSGVVVLHLDDVVDPAHDPAEQTLVHGLGVRGRGVSVCVCGGESARGGLTAAGVAQASSRRGGLDCSGCPRASPPPCQRC